jgi:hypothetical protein
MVVEVCILGETRTLASLGIVYIFAASMEASTVNEYPIDPEDATGTMLIGWTWLRRISLRRARYELGASRLEGRPSKIV